VFRVLITDASSKHSLPIQRHIRAQFRDIELIGHDAKFYPLCRHYGYLESLIHRLPLEEVLARRQFDMVIPVAGDSVATVAKCCPDLAALPSRESLACCFDKGATVALGRQLAVPAPETVQIKRMDELADCPIACPCVLKAACEMEFKGVCYAHDDAQRKRQVAKLLSNGGRGLEHGVLVQSRVGGLGAGFFALFDHGTPKRVFMHRRIREYPPTGGGSTAAAAYYHPLLKDYGLRILSHLQWHGVAMVEFKHDAADRFVLMEINPKFWGSVELALEAGVNFGADLIRVFRGERLEYSEQYDRELHFYWPLDDDLRHLVRTRQLQRIGDYFQPHARTNLGYSRTADVLKALRMLPKLMWG
jgi:predicted ATP-grasp superfamily ATP-dependent carboligase